MKDQATVTLHAVRVRFLSAGDEEAFFLWLDHMKEFVTARGAGDEILIEVPHSKLSNDQLRELIALFHRYQIDMRQLAHFENRSNRAWLRNKRAYWHDAMFAGEPVG